MFKIERIKVSHDRADLIGYFLIFHNFSRNSFNVSIGLCDIVSHEEGVYNITETKYNKNDHVGNIRFNIIIVNLISYLIIEILEIFLRLYNKDYK